MRDRVPTPPHANWLPALRVYLALSLGLHLLWEAAHIPLYTIWTTGSVRENTFAVVHCATGDVMIAGLALVVALVVVGSTNWPLQGARQVFALTIALGVAYTIYSEWLNITVRQSWAYSPLMPVLPLTGIGLSPLLQWLTVPALALSLATRRRSQ